MDGQMNDLMNHRQFKALLIQRLARLTTKRIVVFRFIRMHLIQKRLDAIERVIEA